MPESLAWQAENGASTWFGRARQIGVAKQVRFGNSFSAVLFIEFVLKKELKNRLGKGKEVSLSLRGWVWTGKCISGRSRCLPRV